MIKIEAKHLKDLNSQVKGLLGTTHAHSVYFPTRFGIHTFFMKYPIDVVILNSENRVVKLKGELLPNRIFLWNPRFERVLELPSGTIQKLSIKQGVTIDLRLI